MHNAFKFLVQTHSTTAASCFISSFSFKFLFFYRQWSLSYEVFSDERPKRHPKTASKRQQNKREVQRGWGAERKRGWPRLGLTIFLCFDLKQILTVSTVQATGSEISPCAQALEDLIQTEHPSVSNWLCSEKNLCLNQLLCRAESRIKMKNTTKSKMF